MTTINPHIADLCTHLRALYAGTPESLVHDLLDHIDAQAERIQEIGAVARQEHVEDDLNMVAADAADAARYRWLRDPSRPNSVNEDGDFIAGLISPIMIAVDESCAESINGQALDAAIDAAIQAKRAAAGKTNRKEAA